MSRFLNILNFVANSFVLYLSSLFVGTNTKKMKDSYSSFILHKDGGKGGIRTHGSLLRITAFPVLPVQPLLHLS